MDIRDKKYLEDTFIVRNADADFYEKPEFTELSDVKVLTPQSINDYLGEYEVQHSKRGSIIYKCTPVFIIESETILKRIE